MTDTSTPVEIQISSHTGIEPIAAQWDAFVPRDVPHLRSGFVRAVERAGMLQDITYLIATRQGAVAGVAVAYTLPLDTVASAPPAVRKVVEKVRSVLPKFLWKPMRICGSPISNADSGVHIAADLPPADQRAVFRKLAEEIVHSGGMDKTYFFKEFDPPSVEAFANELEQEGFFANDPWSGTRLDIVWPTFDDYLAALRKKYRKRIRQEIDLAKSIDLQVLDSFAEVAPEVARLYDQVFARADFVLERANAEFFAAVSDFDQSRLTVARDRETGELLGANLLLFGDTVMHNLYIGFDYAKNEKFHTYFNLVIHSLKTAIERGIKVGFFGQDSYEFKARLGARPFPLAAYMKHRLWPVHAMLKANKDVFFPPNEPVTHDVFQATGAAAADDGQPD
ncbi:MAG: GNAT family N-acetyltransferase [Pirellulales bacterium]